MSTLNSIQTKHFNAIWISDTHLGNRDCRAEFLLDFLDRCSCDTLYLLGDIVDIWALKRSIYWPRSHQDVLLKIIEKAKQGARVIYIPGNHDALVRDLAAEQFMNVEILMESVHTTAAGKRLLMIHGDQFDSIVLASRFSRWFGNLGYEFLLRLNRWSNALRKLVKLPYWSLAYYIKNRVKNARAAINVFECAAVNEAKRRGMNGIVCGHIHQPELRVIDDMLYCNDGDWIESCTALVEHPGGRLELLHWGDIQQAIQTECSANDGEYVPCSSIPRSVSGKPSRTSRKAQ